MPSVKRPIYWDANVWLCYINGDPDRLPILDALLADSGSKNGAIEIITSALSQVEVAFGKAEQDKKALDTETERQIDALWADRSTLKVAEYHDRIGKEARQFIRLALTKGWSLKPMDAIHLATAKLLQCVEFHTYDERLLKFSNDIGFPVIEPYVQQPKLV
ncbi:MAG: type II toxin-antitoxin system VapC family toxin [Chloroflexi bacterium]|nr:type II toxin-antitoxin system VapC family toxin [Chloroflexota bacterium]